MRPTVRHLAAVLVALPLLAALAGPAAAKEFLQATLDAPIAMDTPPGTEILVGVTVLPPGDGVTTQPVDGSLIRLILTGRDGSTTSAVGAPDGKPGHHTMRITIPAGGARGAQVVMHGTSDHGLPLRLMADPFTFGGVTARTAQVAPPLAPGKTSIPLPSAPGAVAPDPAQVVAGPGSAVTAPSTAGEVSTAPARGWEPALVLVAAALVAVLALALLALVRRSGGGRRGRTADPTPGV